MGYIITFVLGACFGFAVAACLIAAKDHDDAKI